jgi:hypothetical protein
MQQILHSLHYLPCIAYFCAWAQSDKVMIDTSEPYQKQSYRNRTQILTSQGVLDLIVPIRGNKKTEEENNAVSIDYSQKWVDLHIRSIQTAYGKAPFFTYFFEEFVEIYQRKIPFLTDFNTTLLTLCRKILQLPQEVEIIQNGRQDLENVEIIDYRQDIHPKKIIPKHLTDSLKPYTQVFGKSFVPNMSILDLIFCEGINAKKYF